MANEEKKVSNVHLDHRLRMDWTAAADLEDKNRHDEEVRLYTLLLNAKNEEKKKLEADLKKIEGEFEKMKDYQDALKETDRLRKKIELDKVQVQYLEI